MNAFAKLNRMFVWSALFGLTAMFASCDNNIIFEEQGDCEANCRISFKYDMNMKFADAFPHETTDVRVFAFDESGVLVAEHAASATELKATACTMPLDLNAGKYKLLCWAGTAEGNSYEVPTATVGQTRIEDLTCALKYDTDNNGNAISSKQLPGLFHGIQEVTLTEEPGTYDYVMPLTKNTNTVRVVLQQLSGEPVNQDLFSFEITDENGLMAYDNLLLTDKVLHYTPWRQVQGSASAGTPNPNGGYTEVSVAMAELTVARLVEGKRPMLTVRRKDDGNTVLSIPLIDYALLVKGYYNRDMSNQEYLDRQDEYNLTFFLDSNQRWINSSIIVYSWKVVLSQENLK